MSTSPEIDLTLIDKKPTTETRAIVVWLHGLGASANDFIPIVPILEEITPGIRYIFPNAPRIPVSVNGGMVMPAWYDIKHTDLSATPDIDGIEASSEKLLGLADYFSNEMGNKVPIILAGFSQGGVIALNATLQNKLNIAGVLVLSAYQPESCISQNSDLSSKLLMMHGRSDPVVPYDYARRSYELLSDKFSDAKWMEYDMPHSVCNEQIEHIANWLSEFV